ncbi:uncharacterized protein LOC143209282 [Lasioglossum baleicum]|uniref:uncharacterized protein LOC143209282 n=1 Tax=Lasioglossum baleicum TaxID=434251 RepID=UPI003FCEAA3B
MSKETLNYRRFTNNVERLLAVYGLFPHQQGIVKYLSILVLVSYCLLFYVISNFFRIHIANISAIIACFSLLTTTINVAMKVHTFVLVAFVLYTRQKNSTNIVKKGLKKIYEHDRLIHFQIVQFLRHREKLARIGDTLETLFEKTSLNQPSSSPVFQYLQPCYRLVCYQFTCMFLTAILYTSKPLLDIAIRNAKPSTPFPSVYPWPIVSTASFAVHYLYEVSMSVSFSIITTAVDAFFTLCSFRVCAVFRAMALELKESPKYHTENREQLLRKCIERHTTLIECRDGMQEIYGPVVLMITLTNGLGMCALIFEVLRVSMVVYRFCARNSSFCKGDIEAEDIPLQKATALSLYLFGKIIQTLTYAWPGDMITSEVCSSFLFCFVFKMQTKHSGLERPLFCILKQLPLCTIVFASNQMFKLFFFGQNEVFRREVYCSDWYEHSNIRVTKLSITILTQRLMVLKAYNLLVISLDLFAKIMNKTLSYYFLLVTLDDAE